MPKCLATLIDMSIHPGHCLRTCYLRSSRAKIVGKSKEIMRNPKEHLRKTLRNSRAQLGSGNFLSSDLSVVAIS